MITNFSEVGSTNRLWWPDLTQQLFLSKYAQLMFMKSHRVWAFSLAVFGNGTRKPSRGDLKPPPARNRVKRAIECVFAQHCRSSSFRAMRQFVEKCWNRPNLTFDDLWWPDLWLHLKIDRSTSSFVVLFDALSNAAYRLSLRGPPEPELEGVLNNPPSGGGKSRGPWAQVRPQLHKEVERIRLVFFFCELLA